VVIVASPPTRAKSGNRLYQYPIQVDLSINWRIDDIFGPILVLTSGYVLEICQTLGRPALSATACHKGIDGSTSCIGPCITVCRSLHVAWTNGIAETTAKQPRVVREVWMRYPSYDRVVCILGI